MASGGSKLSIYGAIAANTGIAIAKFIAGSYTGSSAMISEGVHSLVDTSNGGLLLYGLKRAERPADKTHPFGYGMEIYFWSFVVALLIFALGGGVALYEGFQHAMHPVASTNVTVNYIVLGVAILFEGTSLLIALKEFKKSNGKFSLFKSIRRSKDSSSFAIIVEDFGALIGLVIALIGVAVGQVFNWPAADGIASMCIGVILLSMATFLAVETKALLLGESMDVDAINEIEIIVKSNPHVISHSWIRTVHFGPSGVVLAVDIEFTDALQVPEVEQEIKEIEKVIQSKFPEVAHIFIEAKNRR